MPEINGVVWTKEQIHTALQEGRVDEIWPGATFHNIGGGGDIYFADGSTIRIEFDEEGAS